MLKLKEISNFSEQMAEVADDFVGRLGHVRDQQQEVKGLEKELFKWAMECKPLLNSLCFTFNSEWLMDFNSIQIQMLQIFTPQCYFFSFFQEDKKM